MQHGLDIFRRPLQQRLQLFQAMPNDNHAFVLRSFFQMDQLIECFRQSRDTAQAIARLGGIGDQTTFFKMRLQPALGCSR